jgi:transcription elongation factor GreA
MTLTGFQKLQDELKRLKNVERPEIIDAIASARALGDLSENAEYHAAKERQGLVESRIAELEDKISKASVIYVSKIESDTVKFGATVRIRDENRIDSEFQIVGSDEADVRNGLLPVTSPIAKALIGKTVGETLEIRVPSGVKRYQILEVRYI